MAFCTNCGNALGAGRFCTNCGQPVAAPPPPPPPPSTPPPPPQAGQVPPPAPRYPLYADELAPPAYVAPEPPDPHRPRPRPVWPFVVAALALLLVIGVLAGVAAFSGDSGSSAGPARAATEPGTGGGSNTPDDSSLAARSTVQVPATAPPNQDLSGNPTTYDGENLLDGVPETCWRMPGDGTGEEVTVTLPEETHLQRVGMINGYAKTAEDAQGRELDWYHGNRRVLSVEWVFDDGTAVQQDLQDTVAVQWQDVDVTTTTVVLRLLSVSPPGAGRAARDYTAISDLSFVEG